MAIVEDHPLYRRAVREELDGVPGLSVLGDYRCLEDFAHAHLRPVAGREPVRPAVVVLDLHLPGLSGAGGVAHLRAAGLSVLVLSGVDDATEVLDAFTAGAAGFLGKHADGDEIRGAVRAVATGGSYVSATLAGHLLAVDAATGDRRDEAREPWLTARERQVLALLAAGETEQDVADELGTDVVVVRSHLDRLRRRAVHHCHRDPDRLDHQDPGSGRARFPVAPVHGRAPVAAERPSDGGQVPVERRLAALLEHLPVVLMVVDPHGRVTSMSGAPRSGPTWPTVPVHLDDLFTDGDPAGATALSVHRRALSGEPATGRYRWQGRWWTVRGVPAHEAGVLMVVLDVTAQVDAEAALAAAEKRFRMVMDHSPACVTIQHEDGRYLYVNEAGRRAYGMPAEAVGLRPEDVLPAHAAATVTEAHDRLMAFGGVEFDRWELLLPGGPRIISGHRFRLTDVDGTRCTGHVGIDETEATRQRDALTAWRERYRVLFDRNPIPMLITSTGRDGTVLDANPAFAALLGRRLSEVRGRGAADLAARDDDLIRSDALQDLLAGRQAQVDATTCYPRPDGSGVRARVTCFLLPGAPGRSDDDDAAAAGVVGVIQPEVVLAAPRGPELTHREATILRLRAEGDTNTQIAAAVGLSPRGLDYHLKQLARRLRCPAGPAALVARAYHLGLLATDAWPPQVLQRRAAGPGS